MPGGVWVGRPLSRMWRRSRVSALARGMAGEETVRTPTDVRVSSRTDCGAVDPSAVHRHHQHIRHPFPLLNNPDGQTGDRPPPCQPRNAKCRLAFRSQSAGQRYVLQDALECPRGCMHPSRSSPVAQGVRGP